MKDQASINTRWGALTAEVLVRLGVEDVVISPGSRSTPLTVGFARHPRLQCRVILDERSAAFFALGQAQVRRRSVVLVCTSGTAVANYLPAVVEASESGWPLLLLTADRPAELRHRQAGQAIDQVKIFGRYLRWEAEAPLPDERPDVARAWRDLLAQAVSRTTGSSPGPVQLNCPFREPLGPAQPGGLDAALAEVAALRPSLDPELVQARLPELPERGWIVAGPAQPENPVAYVRALGALADHLGWPIFADVLNPCRHHDGLLRESVITTYEALARSPRMEAWKPDAILQIGPLPTSKGLRFLLRDWQLMTWIVGPEGERLNAVAAPASTLRVTPEQLVPRGGPDRDGAWWEGLAEADANVRAHFERALEDAAHAEPAIAARVFEALPAGTPIFVASSMPVRDAESYWPANDERRCLFFNRGANGIDGTLSTALGMAEASQRPCVLYTGDLALLHDTNGMLAARNSFSGSLTIVCINNGGGGIFHHLPVAREADVFEDYFATPQSVDFRSWAAAYGVEYRLANNVDELTGWLFELPPKGVRLLEVRTDREADALLRRGLIERAVALLD